MVGRVRVLREEGARSVYVCATHGVLSGSAVQRLISCRAHEVVLTDTLPLSPEKQVDSITQLSTAALFADAISSVHKDSSVAELFKHRL